MKEKCRVILIGGNLEKQEYFLESMLELASLCDALDYEVINSYSQNIKDINTGCYIGEGLHTREEFLEISSLVPGMKMGWALIFDHFEV